MADIHDSVVVYCIAIAQAGERQYAEVGGMDVDLGSVVGGDTEAAVAAVQDHCFVFVAFHDIHPYWKEDGH